VFFVSAVFQIIQSIMMSWCDSLTLSHTTTTATTHRLLYTYQCGRWQQHPSGSPIPWARGQGNHHLFIWQHCKSEWGYRRLVCSIVTHCCHSVMSSWHCVLSLLTFSCINQTRLAQSHGSWASTPSYKNLTLW